MESDVVVADALLNEPAAVADPCVRLEPLLELQALTDPISNAADAAIATAR